MVQYNPLPYLPTEEDLPDTDNKPADDELQIFIPALLRAILALLWTVGSAVNLGARWI